MRQTLDALRLDQPHLVGWSGGGAALIEFTAEYPDRVRSLTLVEPAAYWILEQLGDRLEDVERVNLFVHGLFGRPVSEDDLAMFLQLAGFVERARDAPSHPNWGRWLTHRATLSWLRRLVLGERLPNASVVELDGDHAHHIQSIDAFLATFEEHVTGTDQARMA